MKQSNWLHPHLLTKIVVNVRDRVSCSRHFPLERRHRHVLSDDSESACGSEYRLKILDRHAVLPSELDQLADKKLGQPRLRWRCFHRGKRFHHEELPLGDAAA